MGLTNASFNYGKKETTTSFVYDSTGARVKKTVGSTTSVYLGKDYEITGSTTTKHIFLGDRRITTKKSTGEISFIHDDHISSSNVVTDASGNQSALYEYDPYGATVTHTGIDLKHQFTGQEKDDSTGLHYYNARYYDSQLGRFVSADTIVPEPINPQNLNRYTYCNNNPIKFTDPTGHKGFWKKFLGIVAAVAGAVIGAGIVLAAGIGPFLTLGAQIGGIVGGGVGGAFQASMNGAQGIGIVQGAVSGGAQGFAIGTGAGAGMVGPGGGIGSVAASQSIVNQNIKAQQIISNTLGLAKNTANIASKIFENTIVRNGLEVFNVMMGVGTTMGAIRGLSMLVGATALSPEIAIGLALLTVGVFIAGVGQVVFSSSNLLSGGKSKEATEPSFLRRMAQAFFANMSTTNRKNADNGTRAIELVISWPRSGSSALGKSFEYLEDINTMYESGSAIYDSGRQITQTTMKSRG